MMRRNILLIPLVFSLLGNVFFVGSYIVTHHRAEAMHEKGKRIATVVRLLHLSDGQERTFARLRKQAVQVKRQYLHEIRSDRQELWRLLASPQREKNRERTDRIIHHMAQAREQYHRKLRDIIVRFIDSLDEEQQKRFYELFTENKKVLGALFSG